MKPYSKLATSLISAILASSALATSPALALVNSNGDVSPAATTWTSSTTPTIGNTSTGNVLINAGSTLACANGYLGYNTGGVGTATVDGSGSKWTASGSSGLYVGYSGTGTVNVTNGGTVSNTGYAYLGYNATAQGKATIDGAGSTWNCSNGFYIGYNGAGTLAITHGGNVTSSFTTVIAWNSTSTGTATIDGAGSTWNGASLYVGETGTGTVNIANGGTVNCSDTILGWMSGATGTLTVTGPGSAWNTSSTLAVGRSGTGVLTVTNGGKVNSSYPSWIGESANSTGTATVDGSTSMWTNSGYLSVGYQGSGTLNITNGGTVKVAQGTYIANYSCSTGAINFGSNGGSLITQTLYAVPGQITGTGSINTCGIVSDGDLVFDATHGLTRTLAWTNAGQNVTVKVDLTGGSGAVGDLGAGYLTSGTLTIQGGTSVTSLGGMLAYGTGSSGTASVSGPGSSWTTTSTLYVGYSGTGALSITNGGKVSSNGCLVGCSVGSTGTVSVDGPGSTWNSTSITLGSPTSGEPVPTRGGGTLNITNGGTVNVTGPTTVGGTSGNGTINFGPNAGLLTTGSLYASPWQVTGTGTINTRGLVGDFDLVFDATHGASRTFLWNNSGQNVTVNLDLTGVSGPVGDLGAGNLGSGTLTIRDGAKITSGNGVLATCHGSTGVATVTGPGSLWTIQSLLIVGKLGTGTLNITNGGSLNAATASSYVGYFGCTGTVCVDGAQSTWSIGQLNVAYNGPGTLKITNGAAVTCTSACNIASMFGMSSGTITVDGPSSALTINGPLSIYPSFFNSGSRLGITKGGQVTAASASVGSQGCVAMTVGDGSSLSVGTGNFMNGGTLQLSAAPGATSGPYNPITAGSWSGSGTVQPLGGTWNSTAHTFTITAPATATAGHAATFNTLNTQRILITDPATHNSVAAAFQPTTTSSNLTFTASLLTAPQTAVLNTDISAGSAILAGWTFTTTNYTSGNPVYLSLDAGPGYSASNLQIWHYNGSAWSLYTPSDLSYDGTYANFTVTGFSGYALVAPVPEPASLALLALTAIPLTLRRRR